LHLGDPTLSVVVQRWSHRTHQFFGSLSSAAWLPWIAGCCALAVVFARRPSTFLHAQFWAEGGHVWFHDAATSGPWRPLLHPQDGYFQTLPRLAADFALLVPLHLAPLVLAVIAALVHLLPLWPLLSSRQQAWGNVQLRFLLAIAFLLLPNTQELHADITGSQWILALSGLLILTTNPPIPTSTCLAEALVLFVCGLTGPFAILLLPTALTLAIRRPHPIRNVRLGLIGSGAVLQLLSLIHESANHRPHGALGLSFPRGMEILLSKIALAALIGSDNIDPLPTAAAHPTLLVIALLAGTSAALGLLLVTAMRSGLETGLFLSFCALTFVGSLVTPAVYPTSHQTVWQLLDEAQGIRYWFPMTLAFSWSILWLLVNTRGRARLLPALLALTLCVGIVRDFRLPARADTAFRQRAIDFEQAPPGTTVTFPLNPAGWTMTLTRH